MLYMYRSLHTYSQTLTSSVIYLSVCFIYLKLELSKRTASNDNNFKYPVQKIDKCVLFIEVIIIHKNLAYKYRNTTWNASSSKNGEHQQLICSHKLIKAKLSPENLLGMVRLIL